MMRARLVHHVIWRIIQSTAWCFYEVIDPCESSLILKGPFDNILHLARTNLTDPQSADSNSWPFSDGRLDCHFFYRLTWVNVYILIFGNEDIQISFFSLNPTGQLCLMGKV